MRTPKLSAATILVPVDFDEASRRAVSTAVEFARLFGGRVVILHVIPPTSFPEGTRLLPVDAVDPIDLGEYVSNRAKRLLNEYFASVLIAGVEVRKEARAGRVVDTVLRAVGESDAKLVVVGTHGRTGVSRLVLGSVAEGVLRRSPVPVLILRELDGSQSTREHDRAYVGAAAMSGAVAGVATGALAGPAGAIAGGAIGTVIGAIAGAVMKREDARADAHDHELDDVIGVTRGTLGTPPETKRPSKEVLAEAVAEAAR
jgi:nucleotide-binding universal stress UspA family protein